MDILCIGNSFSGDSSRYLHQIAKASGETINVFNLYIGGCSLERHYRNMLSEEKTYELCVNGFNTKFFVSLKETLLNRKWDAVSLQQASHFSVDFETYQPYLDALAEYVKKLCPKAKFIIHQTWAYEEGSDRLCKELEYSHQQDMFKDIEASYKKAAKAVSADMIIPSGELFQMLIKEGITHIHRDTFHASFGIGRYALGLLWYKSLTKNSVISNTFSDFDEEIEQADIEIIKNCIEKIKV